MSEYENWMEMTPDAKNWKSNITSAIKTFWSNQESERELIDMVFKLIARNAGAVLERAAYHHGMRVFKVQSSQFCQFGIIAQSGKNAASARYISVAISEFTRKIFHPHDDSLLSYCNDDVQSVEPEWNLPIHLVNGSEGWIHPRDIVNNLKRLINNEYLSPMHPWYRGFQIKDNSTIGTSNMVCFDGEGRIRKYNSPEEILKEFYLITIVGG
ncbi:19432_t:CDS:2, partial [Funneliformis geosporum]